MQAAPVDTAVHPRLRRFVAKSPAATPASTPAITPENCAPKANAPLTKPEALIQTQALTQEPLQELRQEPNQAQNQQQNQNASPNHKPGIAVVGMSCEFPGASNADEFWQVLEQGRDCISDIPASRWNWQALYGDAQTEANKTQMHRAGFINNIDKFDPLFFGISPTEALTMDPQQRLLLTHVWQALEDAAIAPSSLSGSKTAVLFGTASSGYDQRAMGQGMAVEGYTATGMSPSLGPNRISFLLNLHGPSEPIETACSSALVATHRAIQTLRSGECDLALTGGVNTLLSPVEHISFSKAGMLSPTGRCQTFSNNADGYARGEGVGVVVLKRLADADRDRNPIYGLILGSAENHGGKANSLTAPNVKAQADLLVSAYRDANIAPQSVSYIETHGTGTPLGDPIEINGLLSAFSDQTSANKIWLGSVKTNVGHLEIAAGIAGLIKVLLQFKHRRIAQSLHCDTLNPYIDFTHSPFAVAQQAQDWQTSSTEPRRAGVSSFGFGGVNAHVVMQEYVAESTYSPATNAQATNIRESNVVKTAPHHPAEIVLSAKTQAQLRARAEQLLQVLLQEQYSNGDLANIAYTLQLGRDAYPWRLGMVAWDLPDLQQQLQGYLNEDKAQDQSREQNPQPFFTGRVKRNELLLRESAKESAKQSTNENSDASGAQSSIPTNPKERVQKWVAGEFSDWQSLYDAGSSYHPLQQKDLIRLNLPVYPFDQSVYWLEPVDMFASANSNSSPNTQAVPTEQTTQTVQSARAFDLPGLDLSVLDLSTLDLAGLERVSDSANSAFDIKFAQALMPQLWQQLQAIGFTVSAEDWQCNNNVLPEYHPWLHQVARVMRSNGFVSGLYQVEAEQLENDWQTLIDDQQAHASQINLAQQVLSALPEILKGKAQIDAILYPEWQVQNSANQTSANQEQRLQLANIDAIYRQPSAAKASYHALAQTVKAAVTQAAKANRRLRILEIGACNGAATEAILAQLNGLTDHIEEYCYTDITPAFLQHAKHCYLPNHRFMRCSLFNADFAPTEQGFTPNQYDMVIASNVLFATQNVSASLGHIQQLLTCSNTSANTSSGVLLINEHTEFNLFTHLVLGLTKGWFGFEQSSADRSQRIAGSPLLSRENWQALLADSGYSHIQEYAPFGHQALFVVHAPAQLSQTEQVAQAPAKPLTQATQASQATRTSATSAVSSQMLGQDVQDMLRDVVSNVLSVPEHLIENDMPFTDYGVDSILAVNLITTVNRRCNLSLPVEVLFDYMTVERLQGHILSAHFDAISRYFAGDSEMISNVVSGTDTDISMATEAPVQNPAFEKSAVENLSTQNPSAQKSNNPLTSKIAVIGMSGRFAESQNCAELWQHLINGDDLVKPISRWALPKQNSRGEAICFEGALIDDIDKFDPWFFNISGTEAIFMEPQQRLFLQESWNALEDAGYACDSPYREACGVYVGCETSDYHNLFAGKQVPPQGFWGNSSSITAARIAYFLDLQGPAMTMDTACSSSLSSIHIACQAIRLGDATMAVAGGVFIQSTSEFYYLSNNADMLSVTGHCHTFDNRADGFIPGEGVAAVVLKTLDNAIADGDHIYASIVGSGMNQDGATNGITAPSGNSQTRLECDVYERFNINPAHIQYMEAHGTGTPLGDPIEFRAISNAFRRYTPQQHFCAIGSIKSNMGHLVTAAGIAGAIKTILSLHHGKIVPSLNFENGNPAIDFANSAFYVNTELKDWPAPVEPGVAPMAAISSFGFGGTNAHMVFEQAPQQHSPLHVSSPTKAAHLIVLSARAESQLEQQVSNLLAFLFDHEHKEGSTEKPIDLGHLSFTLLAGRKHFEYRLATIARNRDELRQSLTKWQQQFALRGFSSGTIGRVETGALNDNKTTVQQSLLRFGDQCLSDCAQHQQGAEYLDNLATIGHLYCQGYELDYGQLFVCHSPDARYLRLSLPTYPFAKERCWVADEQLDDLVPDFSYIDNPHVDKPSVSKQEPFNTENGLEIVVMQPHWQELSQKPSLTQNQTFSAAPSSANKLIIMCSAPSLGDSWQVSSAELQQRLLVARAQTGESDVSEGSDVYPEIQCHELTLPHTQLGDAALALAEKLTQLLQVGVFENSAQATQLLLLLPNDANSELLRASYGLLATAVMEAGGLHCAVMSADATLSQQALTQLVQEQLQQPETQIRYSDESVRSELQWQAPADFAPISESLLEKQSEQTPLLQSGQFWQADDVYLITGGLGGVGLIFARDMVATGRKLSIILCGRTAQEALSASQLATINELNQQAATVVYRQVDLGDSADVQRLVNNIQVEFGGLTGILHSAGITRDNFIARKDIADIAQVLRPKVQGLINLDNATAQLPLRFFVAFSSAAAIDGNVGQSDYAFANAFMDSYMQHRHSRVQNGERQGESVSVNWPQWRDGGMSIDQATMSIMAEWGMYPMPGQLGVRVLQSCVAHGAGHYVIYCGDTQKIHDTLSQYRQSQITAFAQLGRTQELSQEQIQEQAPRQAEEAQTAANTTITTTNTDLLSATQQQLTALFANIAKLPAERLKPNQSFNDYGMDSLIVTEMNHQLGKHFGNLSKTLFYERDSIAAVSDYLVSGFASQCQRWTGLASSEASNKKGAVQAETHASKSTHTSKSAQASKNTHTSKNRQASIAALLKPEPVLQETVSQRPGSKTPTPELTSPENSALCDTCSGTHIHQQPQENRAMSAIAIIGLAGRYPQANNVDLFWDNLQQGKDSVTEIPADRWSLDNFYIADIDQATAAGRSYSKWGGFLANVDCFDSELFGISPREAQNIDPQERLFMEICWEVLEDAGYTPELLRQQTQGNVGVFAGITKTGFEHNNYAQWQQGRPTHGRTSFSSLANRVSFVFDFHGPSMPIDTMCSASLTAIHEACLHLRAQECEVAIAGGVNLYLHPKTYADMCFYRMLSDDGRCKSFGEGGNGFVPGEGVGAVLLKPQVQAEADGDHIYGLVLGSAVNHGGRTHGYTVPNPNAQGDLINTAFKRAGVNASDVAYIEAHGTGTSLGDPIEITGLTRAFSQTNQANDSTTCALGSVKSNIGHLEAAAGIAGVSKILLQFKHSLIAPTLHAERENPNLDLAATPFRLQKRSGAFPVTVNHAPIAGISSFGAGSANAHVVLQQYHSQAAQAHSGEVSPSMSLPVPLPVSLVLSAKSTAQLQQMAQRLLALLHSEQYRDQDLPAMAFTLQTGRVSMTTRIAFVVSSISELQTQLQAFVESGNSPDFAASSQGLPEAMAQSVSQWLAGDEVNWQSLYTAPLPKRRLPTYAFEARAFPLSYGELDDIPEAVGIEHAGPAQVYRNAKLPQQNQVQTVNNTSESADSKSGQTESPQSKSKEQNPWTGTQRTSERTLQLADATLASDSDYAQSSATKPVLSLSPLAVASVPIPEPEKQPEPAQPQAQIQSQALSQKPIQTQPLVSAAKLEQELGISLELHLMLDEGELDPCKDFVSLGLDSVLGVEWVQLINQQYATNVPVTALYDFPTLTQLTEFLLQEILQEMGNKTAVNPEQNPSPSEPALIQETAPKITVAKLVFELGQSLEQHLMLDEGELDTGKDFISLGLDSVLGVEWIQQINQRYHTNVPVTALYDYPSLEAMAEFLLPQLLQQQENQTSHMANDASAITLQILQQLQSGEIDPDFAKQQLNEFDYS